ncbi:MAG: beta-ketoacyl synthase chain length factor [Victivallaceae bacterium]
MLYINGYGLTKPDGTDALPDLAAALQLPDGSYNTSPLPDDMRKKLRRTGAFHSSAVTAAAAATAGLSPERLTQTAIVLVSRFGDQDTTGSFIDDLIDFGLEQGSPTKFAHSNHNTAAAYVARLLGINGPAITAINTQAAFYNGLILARCQLESDSFQDILLLHVESLSMISKVLFEEADGAKYKTILPENIGVLMQSAPQCEAACILFSNAPSDAHCCRINFSDDEIADTPPQSIATPIETVLVDAVTLITKTMTVSTEATCHTANGNGANIVLHLQKI